jgi:regulator of protease activity HflC (stomatin/prohibitin superfamily)
MTKFTKLSLAIAISAFAVGCTRIETGEVGVRVDYFKQVQNEELMAGSVNQTLIGDVLTFPVKDVQIDVVDMNPVASDNSTMKDFDMVVIYSINVDQIADIYIDKNKKFHFVDADGDILLMYNYIYQVARNAAYKSARKYEALKMGDNRESIEQEVKEIMVASLEAEGLSESILIQQVLVRNILPADEIVDSANALVESKNRYLQKEVEVQTARKEAERIAVLNANAGAVGYMEASATVMIAEAVRDGKVNTIIIPYDFKGIVDTRKPQ